MKQRHTCWYTLVTCLLLVQHTLKAQHDYTPGYIVLTAGDTIKGYLRHLTVKGNDNAVEFRDPSSHDLSGRYTPDQLTELNVNGEHYHSLYCRQKDSLGSENEIKLFFKEEYKGVLSLYSHDNGDPQTTFYVKQDAELTELVYGRVKKTNAQGELFQSVNRTYAGQLKILTKGCPQLSLKTESAEYNKFSIVTILDAFNNCKKSSGQIAKSDPRKLNRFYWRTGVTAGLMHTVSKDPVNQHQRSNTLAASLYADLVFPGANRKFSLYNELAYSSYRFVHKDASQEFDLQQKQFQLNPMLRWCVYSSAGTVYISVGPSFWHQISTKNTVYNGNVLYPIEGVKNRGVHLLLAAGYKQSKLVYEIRYQRSAIIVGAPSPLSASSIYISVGYMFSKTQ